MTAITLMNHDNKVIFSVDNHTWMETSLEALYNDIILNVSQLNVISFYPTGKPVNSPDRPVSLNWSGGRPKFWPFIHSTYDHGSSPI